MLTVVIYRSRDHRRFLSQTSYANISSDILQFRYIVILTARVRDRWKRKRSSQDKKCLKMVLNRVKDDELGCSCQAGPGIYMINICTTESSIEALPDCLSLPWYMLHPLPVGVMPCSCTVSLVPCSTFSLTCYSLAVRINCTLLYPGSSNVCTPSSCLYQNMTKLSLMLCPLSANHGRTPMGGEHAR